MVELVRGTFYLEDVGEIVKMSCEPNIAPEHLFPINGMNGSHKI